MVGSREVQGTKRFLILISNLLLIYTNTVNSTTTMAIGYTIHSKKYSEKSGFELSRIEWHILKTNFLVPHSVAANEQILHADRHRNSCVQSLFKYESNGFGPFSFNVFCVGRAGSARRDIFCESVRTLAIR